MSDANSEQSIYQRRKALAVAIFSFIILLSFNFAGWALFATTGGLCRDRFGGVARSRTYGN